MATEQPKVGDIFYRITIDKGIISKSNPMIVKDKYVFSLTSLEFTDGNNRFDIGWLYPCHSICGGPDNAPLGMGYDAFIYALEKDVDAATQFLIERYIEACLNAKAEATQIANKLGYYVEYAESFIKGE